MRIKQEKEMINRMKVTNKGMNRAQNNFKAIYHLICLTAALFLIFSTPISILASQSDEDDSISRFEIYLDNSPYSDFQKRMVLNTVQEAMEDGISQEDTLSLVKNSVKNNIDPYNLKKFIDTLVSTKKEGISEKPILNKIKEGLAKNVDQRLIISAINQKSENMLIAKNLLTENEIQNGECDEMIDILADSLANGVPPNVLLQVLKMSSEQDKSWQEVEEITQELASLGLKAIELGIDSDKIETMFKQAVDGNTNIENICPNIQDLMVAAIAVKVTSSTVSRDSSIEGINGGINGPDLSSSGGTLPGTGSSTISGETGSSPISSSGNSKTDNESGSSPLK